MHNRSAERQNRVIPVDANVEVRQRHGTDHTPHRFVGWSR